MANTAVSKRSFFSRRVVMGATVGAALVFFFSGIIFWGGFNTAMEATNNLEFCISCHEMEENVYKEYLPSIHYSNRTGVRATCPDCHVPDPWIHKMIRKVQASNEVFHKLLGTVDTPEKFDQHRLEMAKRVWSAMKSTDSRECRNCHNFESMNPEFQKPRARKQHLNAFETGQTCIDCHKGIAHKKVRDQLDEKELEALEAPNPKYVRAVPQLYLDGLKRVEEKEAKQKAEDEAAKKAEKDRFDTAVAAAVAASASKQSASASAAAAPSAGQGPAVDWGKAGNRDITIFYPGETSIEWVMTGKDHGGARPFMKGGDRCMTCHDKETASMGAKMVNGEKAESKPIPGKRGSIPVSVAATQDGQYLYMRFSWDDSPHVPVPFVEGGKMDPDNQIKLAMMFATDDVEYADRAGCWGTCHHDLRSMPDTSADVAGSPLAASLDLSKGVTKYIAGSRTEIDVKGNSGKRGGWDKLKSADELKTEMDAHKFMDLVRFSAGKGLVEDGHVLEQRSMSGGEGAEFTVNNEAGRWVVTMKRKLTSDKPGDISLEQGKVYNFGFAIHDDYSNARFHHVSLGYKLGIGAVDGADLSATAQ